MGGAVEGVLVRWRPDQNQPISGLARHMATANLKFPQQLQNSWLVATLLTWQIHPPSELLPCVACWAVLFCMILYRFWVTYNRSLWLRNIIHIPLCVVKGDWLGTCEDPGQNSHRCFVPKLVEIGAAVSEKKLKMFKCEHTTHDDGQKRMAIGHLSLLRWPKNTLLNEMQKPNTCYQTWQCKIL